MTMASISMTILPPPNAHRFSRRVATSIICSVPASSSSSIYASDRYSHALSIPNLKQKPQAILPRFMHISSPGEELRGSSRGVVYASAGLEASIGTDAKEGDIKVKATVSVESQDDEKIQLRVDVTGDETDKVFNLVLRNLASTAPPIPGFRRQKGGKTTQVPKDFLLTVLGEERVTKFVIQEIVSSTVADYVKKESLVVKENKLNTTQTLEELIKIFSPGKEFGFNANLELEKEADDSALQDSDIIDVIADTVV